MFPDVKAALNLLGYRARDKVTGWSGVITSVAFDLYGCVQATLNPGVDKEGRLQDLHWFDLVRLEVSNERVMNPPAFGFAPPADYQKGAADKPAPKR